MTTETTNPNAPKPKKSVALSGTPAGNTALCTVGRSGNDLHYRGYDILDFAEQAEFEEVAYLLVHEKLPTRDELKKYKNALRKMRGLPKALSVDHAVALAQQASSVTARSAGKLIVGATLMGAGMAALVWLGLSLRPNLWMLMLWLMAAALWAGAKLFRARASSLPPPFWVAANALMTLSRRASVTTGSPSRSPRSLQGVRWSSATRGTTT